jgi:drug/metabolite transporter (DMT)-like permease
MRTEWVCILLVAVFWGGYPLIARLSSVGGALASLWLGALALVPVAAAAVFDGASGRPTRADLWPLALAGLMQGAGLLAFVRLATGKLDASVAIPISDVAMLIVTTAGAIAFFREPLTAQKVAGFALLLAGIFLLRSA